MLESVTVAGSSALLNWIWTVRLLSLVSVMTGEETSSRVKLMLYDGTRSLPSFDFTTGPPVGLWIENVYLPFASVPDGLVRLNGNLTIVGKLGSSTAIGVPMITPTFVGEAL